MRSAASLAGADPGAAAKAGAHLVLAAPSYYPDVYGGAERQATILAQALRARGVFVTLLCPVVARGLPAEESAPFGRIRRIPVSALPAGGGRGLLATLSWTVRAAAFIAGQKPQAVYVFHGRLHAIGPLVGARLAGRPAYIKPGGGGAASEFQILRGKKFLYGHIAAALVRRWTAGFVANSANIADDLLAEGVPARRIWRISNGVAAVDAGRRRIAEPARTGRWFIFTGRLVAEKGVQRLLQAAALCLPAAPDLLLTIVGDGPDLDALRREAQALGLAGVVRFPGRVDDLTDLLLAHDFFVSASLREGQSNALLEAIAAGLIPVCAPASGVEDVVGDGVTGLVAASGAADDLARAMEEALGLSPARRAAMSAANLALAQARLSIEAVADQTLVALGLSGAARP